MDRGGGDHLRRVAGEGVPGRGSGRRKGPEARAGLVSREMERMPRKW